jgi:FkbM family methyltransferase
MIKSIIKRLKGTRIYPFLRKIPLPQNLKRKLFKFKGEFDVETKDGKKFKLFNPPFHLETEIYWQGIDNFEWEIKTRQIWVKLSKVSNVVFDIGANTGIFSVLTKAYNQNSKVYAFEPQPNIFSVLSKNNTINNYNIKIENLALSNAKGEMPFYNYGNDAFNENSTAGSLNPDWRTKNQKSIVVKVDTLDHYVTSNNIEKIDLIKLDVESFEVEVLQGYKNSLLLHKPIFIIEIISKEIGLLLQDIFDSENYCYYNIDETKGVERVDELGNSECNNFLIFHKEKEKELKALLNL